MVTFALTHRDYRERVGKFLKMEGPHAPQGVTVHGMWVSLGHDRGYILAETDRPELVFQWTSWWADLIDFEVHPVLTGDQIGQVLGAMASG
jgi:hypothetical protein